MRCKNFSFIAATLAVLIAAPMLQATQVVVTADRDLGLYGQETAPTAAPGVMGSNRGGAGRMDVSGLGPGAGGGPDLSSLLSFDVAGIVPAGKHIASATLELYRLNDGGGWGWDADVVAYPLADTWGEGDGFQVVSGDSGFPWGPTQIGDSTKSFRQTTAVVNGEGSWAGYDVASAGVAWNTPGALGIGTDLLNRKMFESRETGGFINAGVGNGPDGNDQLIAALSLNSEGIDVVTEWANGTLTNNGLNLFFETDYGDGRFIGGANEGTGKSQWRAATSEFVYVDQSLNQFPGAAAPRLVLQIVPEPSSLLLIALGMAGAGLFQRRER